MSKLLAFLKTKKIDARRIVVASRPIESLQPEDRATKLARLQAKAPNATDAIKEKAVKKPRSGRPVSMPLLNRALAGGPIPGAAKTRILRAINQLLVQKKQAAVTLKELF